MNGELPVWNQANWFAIQAKPHREQLAAAQVARLDLEVFLPRVKQPRLVCGVPRVITKALFPGYCFARFVPKVSIDAVRYSSGVLRVVGTSQFPVPVESAVISRIRERLHADGLIHLEPKAFGPGDLVRIEQGPFEGFMGKVERELDDGKRVAILLEALQQARLLVEKQWISSLVPV